MTTTEYNKLDETISLLTKVGDGVLSTFSLDVEGYPFGSITPFCLDEDFQPNILISSLAQHTKNIIGNPKVSLTMVAPNHLTNKQSKGRITYIGDASLVEDNEAIKSRYLSYFPQAKNYFGTHDFHFYKIDLKRIRFIGGFGKIFWLEKDEMKLKNIFDSKSEAGIVGHMNADHNQNLRDYCQHYLGLKTNVDDAVAMLGLDQFGFDVGVSGVKHRIDFKEIITDPADARKVFVAMAKESRGES